MGAFLLLRTFITLRSMSPLSRPWVRWPLLILAVLLLFGLGIAGGFVYRAPLFRLFGGSKLAVLQRRLGLEDDLINPLLYCGDSSSPSMGLSALQSQWQAIVQQEQVAGHVENVSVYFREMNSGQWMGLDENRYYYAASLLKVPFMLATLKMAEQHSSFLDHPVLFSQDLPNVLEPNIVPEQRLQPGQSYSVDELLKRMITYSSNNAAALLANQLGQVAIDQVFKDIESPVKQDDHGEALMTPKDYSTFFRVLYNATYLDRDLSAKALGLLAQSDYADGLVAGLPTGTRVAHKFGERTFDDASGQTVVAELHDCGIVYAADQPYFLCVMTHGKKLDDLTPVIQKISDVTYQFVTSHPS